MKKQIMNIVAAISFLFMVSAVSAYAQAPEMKANIPFDFQIQGKVMSAGAYTFTEPISQKNLLIIRGDQKDSAAATIAYFVDAEKQANGTKLVFRRYGDQYFLAQLIFKDSAKNRELPTTKAERAIVKEMRARHLAGNQVEPQIVTITAAQ